LNFTDAAILTNFFVSAARPDNLFETNYLNVRRKERRLYRDEEVMALPDIRKNHPHCGEWMIRKRSCQRLIHYLEVRKSRLQILEIGCGNGWLSAQLAGIPGSEVIGSDINWLELQQAARVFSNKPKLKFIYGDIRSGMLQDLKFDVIVLAASIQYFPALDEIMDCALPRLNPRAELHILDSPFYKPSRIGAAVKRTQAYYNALGFPEMAAHYHHHGLDELEPYHYKILSNPHSFRNRIFGKNPFPWVCVKND
jgi:SAM-dependent methyltransferase